MDTFLQANGQKRLVVGKGFGFTAMGGTHKMGAMEIKPDCFVKQLPPGGLFRTEGIPWRISPLPLPLTKTQVKQLQGLGHILALFQDASHQLYRQSVEGTQSPWIAPMLEAGKPNWLVQAQRSQLLAQAAPSIIRPDLLWTKEGFALSELDSVPGGLGLTLWLSRIYAQAGYPVLGGGEGIVQGFRAAHPQGAVIAISQESADYLPEMRYLAHELGEGFRWIQAEQLDPEEKQVYRFFELFDTDAVPAARPLIKLAAKGQCHLSPPPIPHLEEKIWLALFHTPGLQPYWQQHLRAAHLQRLKDLIPRSWIVDPAPLPPQAALPWLNLHNWEQVATLSQKERKLVLKISGFDPTAWGSRGVFIGHDLNSDEWRNALHQALKDFPKKLWLLQEFRESQIIEHPYFTESGTVDIMQGRVRLCPYYFRTPEGYTSLGGCLATIVPKDKKKIHGMTDAILAPCVPA